MNNNRPQIPPPEIEPFVPEDPPVEQQQAAVTIAVSPEITRGTSITTPVSENTFLLKLELPTNQYASWSRRNNVPIPLTITGTGLSLVNASVIPSPLPASINTESTGYSIFYLSINIAGSGTGTLSLPFQGPTNYFLFPTSRGNVIAPVIFSPRTIAINIVNRPILTISGAQNPVGTFLDDEININSFYADFTWDEPVSAAFTASDVSVTSSNSAVIGVTFSNFENVGTAGTTTHFRGRVNLTGQGISTITITVPAGAIPAAGGKDPSIETTRSYTVNTLPAPRVTIGPAQNPVGTTLTDINVNQFYTDLTWNTNVGTAFARPDINVVSNNPDLRVAVDNFETVTAGTVFRARIQISGGGAGVVTVYVERGAIPATLTRSSSVVTRRSYQVTLDALPAEEGTASGPTVTQGGGAVLIKAGGTAEIQPPELVIQAPNINEVKQTSRLPVNLIISYIFDEPVNGFTQEVPNYEFIPRENERGISENLPQIGEWSGISGNATYQQIIEIQADTAGRINIFVPPRIAESTQHEDSFGPEEPGVSAEFFYDVTIAGNPAPNVNISTPPTTNFIGETFTTIFYWDQEIEEGTFRAAQVLVGGATAGDLVPDPDDSRRFTMELTLPATGNGEVAITVLGHRLVSTAAMGIVSRREGPEETKTETFLYDQQYSDPLTTVDGGSTLCTIEVPVATSNVLYPSTRSPGGAFAGAGEVVHISNISGDYLYFVVQVIKRKVGTTQTLSNANESGAVLYELNLRTLQCRPIKNWISYTSAARSLTEHNGQVYWFEGSHYGHEQKHAEAVELPEDDA